ncbi:catalase [Rubidibacter lacunae KORDI 51-2]|uniref:Catalase n=1 Tax=Rubidibacter lacunae KORDI 51-2 TaxID=582515 RepID=U5DSU0_9CHRO|nr:catalase family protein [Rubidibacter lacunae]ERN42755.1 catalase [Rubidibacter lacunae KORDI 51-2]
MTKDLEHIPENERQDTASLEQMLQAKMTRDYPPPARMQRDAHPKQHGLVKAEFIVEENIPVNLKIGVFKQPCSYKAWIRFSNQNSDPQPDNVKDIRGMAIKLMGVSGEKLLEEEKNATTHDFILISTPMFVTKSVNQFEKLIAALVSHKVRIVLFFLLNPGVLINLLRSNKNYPNPLAARYWSSTPYQYGDRIVKYSAKPNDSDFGEIPDSPDENYLRSALSTYLSKKGTSFDFMVQLRNDSKSMPIEDSSKRWSETESPFIKVATIKIHRQKIDSPEQFAYGNTLSFNPWHALPEHRPLGGINRARKVIYESISKFRHEKNNIKRHEPVDFSPFEE